MENTEVIINKLDEITRRLDEIAALLNAPAPAAQRSSASATQTTPVGGLAVKPDGTASGMFRVMKEPRRWNSDKGCFVSCIVEGLAFDEWVSVGITDKVAAKVGGGYTPRKGDVISVSGKYEEQVDGDRTFRSVFAYKIVPQNGATSTPNPMADSAATAGNNDPLPF